MMWLNLLKREVELKGVEQVAKELGLGTSTINLVLYKKYGAKTDRIEKRVLAIYGGKGGMVPCPVLGMILPDVCATKWNLAKKIGMRAGNPETLRLYKSCLNCELRSV